MKHRLISDAKVPVAEIITSIGLATFIWIVPNIVF